ncbi:hypothetical protein E4T43_07222 [Aureobasidium subglaciale]|nr:hypothetical protein E4T43_07222 [Aureobasidium subglaciale]
MGPRRKKTKQSEGQDEPDSTQSDNTLPHKTTPLQTDQDKAQGSGSEKPLSNPSQSSNTSSSPATPTSTPDKRGSWYKGGSWRSKANPVAQATHESISVAGGSTNESLADSPKSGGRYVHPSLRRSSKSIPTISSDSINATGSNAKTDKPAFFSDNLRKSSTDFKKPPIKEQGEDTKDINGDKLDRVKEGDVKTDGAQVKAAVTTFSTADLKPLPADTSLQQTKQTASEEAPLPPEPTQDAAPGWFGGWWSRPDGYTDHSKMVKAQDEREEASSTPLPSTPEQTPTQDTNLTVESININDTVHSTRSVGTTASSRSWFGLWSNAQNQQQSEQQTPDTPSKDASPDPLSTSTEQPAKATEATVKEPVMPEIKQGEETPQNKSSGWAFWSRAQEKDESDTPNGTQRQVGELAVADTPSQSHPEAAQFNEQRQQKAKSTKLGLSATNSGSTTSLPAANQPQVPLKDTGKTPDTNKTTVDVKSVKSQARPNLVIPSFDESYSAEHIPSYKERLTTYVASTLRLIDTPAAPKHVSIMPTLPKIKNAIAIGVHGYFPAPLIQKVLGQPTGTSIRFANYASTAIRDWVETNQPDTPCEIETVALEGEGFIADRVATLWKLMLNWLSHLRQADLILVACHSQGVPVAIMLVHKLLQLGCLSPHAKIGICAMAGVNLGPFADYKSRWLGAGAAAELFEFSRQDSRVSTEYKAALDGVLRHGVRITYCGSIDDQLVSLESSTFTTLTHPYVYRAIFVDGRLHAPNFLTHLVGFALKLRNLGISDHGLIRELSLPLAGSLYGGEGHSRIYDDPAVYTLSLRFCLETSTLPTPTNPPTDTTSTRSSRAGPPSSVSAANSLRRGSVSSHTLPGIAPIFAEYEIPASGSNSNPYFLPWALRGILEEERVKSDMEVEVQELVKMFEEWRPSSKVLKDVRFRLEGVRSKL